MTLFSDPFRPFFLLAGLQAALAVPLWLLLMSGLTSSAGSVSATTTARAVLGPAFATTMR